MITKFNVEFAKRITRPLTIYCKFMLELEQVQKQYKSRLDSAARGIHWDLSGKCGLKKNERWYAYVPESVLEMTTTNIDRISATIQTDHEIGARRPDLMIIDQKEKKGESH